VVEDVCEGGMAIMPMIGRARLLRMWGGIMDMSMDDTPHDTATAYRFNRFETGHMIDEKGMGNQPNLH